MKKIFVSYITLDFRGGNNKSRATTVGMLVYMTSEAQAGMAVETT